MNEWVRSIDASAVSNWILLHSASALGQAGSAFVGGLIAMVIVGTLVFMVNLTAFVACARRSCWPLGHVKWAWLLAIAVAFIVSIAIPGFYVWLGLAVPIAYWLRMRRLSPSTS